MSKDYYKILGVEKSANAEEIKQAYRKLALKYHPDKGGGVDSEAKFKEASEAYAVLSDSSKRQQYDQFGSNAFNGQGGFGGGGFDFSNFSGAEFSGFEDIFESFFGGNRGGTRAKRDNRRGRDLELILELSFEEAVFGIEKQIQLNAEVGCEVCGATGSTTKKLKSCSTCGGSGYVTVTRQTMFGAMRQSAVCNECAGSGEIPEEVCKKCRGQGRYQETVKVQVKIPAGIDDGQTIRVGERGGAGVRGGKNGDLYLVVRVLPSREYRRDGHHLYKNVDVPYTKLVLGGVVQVPTLYGEVRLKIPAATQVGEVFKIKGYGVAMVDKKAKGDLFLQLGVTVPDKLTLKQRKLLTDLDAEL